MFFAGPTAVRRPPACCCSVLNPPVVIYHKFGFSRNMTGCRFGAGGCVVICVCTLLNVRAVIVPPSLSSSWFPNLLGLFLEECYASVGSTYTSSLSMIRSSREFLFCRRRSSPRCRSPVRSPQVSRWRSAAPGSSATSAGLRAPL